MNESVWIEVRPLATGRFEVGNFKEVLEFMHDNGTPFRFFMVKSASAAVKGQYTVRFFLQFESRDVADYMADLLIKSMDVEVAEASPPTSTYERCADFELKCHYALPICRLGEKRKANPVDKIVESLGLNEIGAALEVIAVKDPGAGAGIRNYILEKTQGKKSFGGVFIDTLLGILGAIFGRNTQKPRKQNFERDLRWDPSVKARLNAAEEKLNRKLFTCTVKAYGNLKTLKIIQDASPSSHMNNLRRHSTAKSVNAPSALRKPHRYKLQNALSNLFWITPLLILLIALHFNLLDPLRLNTIDILTVIVAVASGFPFLLLFRRRNPIVLCLDELSLLASMPTEVRKLPVELGATPPTRKHLPSARGIEKKPPKNPASTQTLPAPPGKLPTAELPCPHCGEPVPAGVEVCPVCGRRLRGCAPD